MPKMKAGHPMTARPRSKGRRTGWPALHPALAEAGAKAYAQVASVIIIGCL